MKISNTTRHSAVKMILGVLFATCAFTASANAQPSFVGKFTLPYEAHWNHAVLPAGEYTVEVDAQGMPALVTSDRTGNSAYSNTPILADLQKGPASLTVTIQGNERRIRSINLPQVGRSLVFEPLTAMEREMFAKAGQIDSVAVITAKK